MHVFVHYADCSRKFGVLKWYWLMSFERFNKKIKGMVGNSTHPMSSLKSALLRDAGIDYLTLISPILNKINPHIHTAMSFKVWRDLEVVDESSKPLLQEDLGDILPLPDDLVIDLQLFGICDCCSHLTLKMGTCHKKADIRGVEVRDLTDSFCTTDVFIFPHIYRVHSLLQENPCPGFNRRSGIIHTLAQFSLPSYKVAPCTDGSPTSFVCHVP